MVRIGIVGANGYTGRELIRLFSGHPQAELAALTSRKEKGKHLKDVFPGLAGVVDGKFEELDVESIARKCDCVFLCLPATQSIPVAAQLIQKGVVVFDHSADFRLKDPQVYRKYYKADHSEPQLLKIAVYGLPELHRAELKNAQLIAVPGCYPTSAILGLAPLFASPCNVKPESVIVNSISSISGAGQEPTEESHFPEFSENAVAYNLGKHRHTPEMEQELGLLCGKQVKVFFAPHKIPINRGIMSTMLVELDSNGLSSEQLQRRYAEYYTGEYFVRVRPSGGLPEINHVRGTNFCDIGVQLHAEHGRVVVVSVIDNLVKGASGLGVQCFNVRFGFDEKTALTAPPLNP